jgi:outer membrane murein-binding lipoprotein Lpp
VSDAQANSTRQLGLGTFVIIAFIVMAFSGGRDAKRLRKSVDELSAKVDRLERKIDGLAKAAAPQAPAVPAEGPQR